MTDRTAEQPGEHRGGQQSGQQDGGQRDGGQPDGRQSGQEDGQLGAQPADDLHEPFDGQPSGQPYGPPSTQPPGQPSTQPSAQPPGQPSSDARLPIEMEVGQPTSLADDLADDLADEPDDEPAGPSRRRLIVLAVLAAVGVAGAAVLGVAGYRIASQKDATLTPPPQIGSFRQDDSEEARATADYLRDALAAEADLDGTVGVIYTDPADPNRSVLLSGGTALVWTPGSDLESVFGLLEDEQGKVTGVADYPAGDLGGELRCGTIGEGADASGVCGWGDHGSLALALFPGRSAKEAAPLMLEFRTAIQKRT